MPLLDPLKGDDFLNSMIVDPGWYRVKLHAVEPKLSSKGDSTNYWIKGKILKNADTGDEKFKGVPTPFLWMINSKAAWSAIPLYRALGAEMKEGTRLNPDFVVDKEVEMFIGNGPDNNQMMTNKVGGQFRAPKV